MSEDYGAGLTFSQIDLAKKIDRYINRAVRLYENETKENYKESDKEIDKAYENALKLAQEEAKSYNATVEFDYPGLYPTFEITMNGKHYCEYSTGNFFRRITGFWD